VDQWRRQGIEEPHVPQFPDGDGLSSGSDSRRAKLALEDKDWSGEYWVTDIWRKSRVRRKWQMVERILSRPDTDRQLPEGIRSLQLWRKR